MAISKIGEYVVDGVLGSGAARTAYRGHHEVSEQPAAIKLLSEEMSKDETMQLRFLREMKVLETLNHPNIVKYYDGGVHDGRYFYAMELVRFGTLKDVLKKRGRLEWRDAAECGAQICAALDRAHQENIVHRDLKPLNLFLSEEGLIKLGDFGLARDLGGPALTQEGMTVGTCLYMAPEQIQALEITHATDIYALGCLLYEMLTGRVPFIGDNAVAILDQHFQAPPPDATSTIPSVPQELSDLIKRMMAKEPADRPRDTLEVKAELERILAADPAETALKDDESKDQPALNLTERLTAGHANGNTAAPRVILILVAAVIVLGLIAAVAMNQ